MKTKKTIVRGAVALVVAAGSLPGYADSEAEYTFTRDILPIVQEKCQECHQPEGIGPFSLMSYRQVRSWSKMIREVVEDGRMPPWHADPHVGTFSNDISLTSEEKGALLGWIDSGMPQGRPEDAPAPRVYTDGWRMGTPDMVFEMPEEAVIEPTGVVPYLYFRTPTNFEEDVWIEAAEWRAGNSKVLHHIVMFYEDPNFVADPRDASLGPIAGRGFLGGYAPGSRPVVHREGVATRIPAGATLIWQMHYTPTGKEERDRSQFGIRFAKGPIVHEYEHAAPANFALSIPPGVDNHRVESELTFPDDVLLYSMSPHMHLRGKSFTYAAVFPDGREQLLLSVPRYDFNWQTTYVLEEPVELPAGTKIRCVAHYDNSSENPYNPDPTKTVTWGDQTWEEMMVGFLSFTWERDVRGQSIEETD